MMLTFTSLLLVPAALALPSYNSYGQGNHHSWHGSGHHHHFSGTAYPIASTGGPFGLGNATASQAGTATGSAASIVSTSSLTLQSTIYQSLTDTTSVQSVSEAATTCGGATVTVTGSNVVTVTVTSGGAEAASSVSSATTVSSAIATSSVLESATSSVPSTTSVAQTTATQSVGASSNVPVTVSSSLTSSIGASSSTLSEADTTSSSAVSTVVASSSVVSSVVASSSTTGSTATIASSAANSATATSSTAPVGTSLPAPPGSKRGLFIPVSQDATQEDYVNDFNSNPGKISWIVNQFSGPPGNLSSEFQYVPQCYDKFSDNENQWTTNAQKAVAAGEKYFLSFGEPNTNNSQNFYVDAQTGAQTFMELLQPYAVNDGITIGSPGTLGAPLDIEWQNDFLDACADLKCKIGWVSCHWFSPCGSATAQELADTFWGTVNTYKGIAQNHSSQYGIDLKVWVDNFSLGPCDSDMQQQFFDIVVPQLDADDMIERYGYVSITDINQGNGLVNTDGSISELGLHYATM